MNYDYFVAHEQECYEMYDKIKGWSLKKVLQDYQQEKTTYGQETLK